MSDPDIEAKILRLRHAEKWPIGTIARDCGVHHSVVRRVLAEKDSASEGAVPRKRRSRIDAYLSFIVDLLRERPDLTAAVVYRMAQKRGYQGGPDHFRHVLRRLRPKRELEPFLRLSTLPGAEAQVDWGSFGKVRIGRAERALSAFVMVLSYSRRLFVRFFPGMAMPYFLLGHQLAFDHFGGTPRTILYDNLKSAVVMRGVHATVFNPELLGLASHHHFEPKACRPRRGNEKGRVERAIRYLREGFFAGLTFRTLDELNAEAQGFMDRVADARPWPEDRTLTVQEAHAKETSHLIPLPADRYPVEERVAVHVGKTPHVRFDRNDYSIPHAHVRSTVVVVAGMSRVRVLAGDEVIAEHERSFDAGRAVHNPDHVAAVLAWKRKARKGHGLDRLRRAVPETETLLTHLAERGLNVGSATKALLHLLDTHGAAELQAGIRESLAREVFHPHGVRHALERRREASGDPPRLPIELPDDPRVRDLTVRRPDLGNYRTNEEG